MLSNLEVNYCSLLIFTVLVPSCTVCKIFHTIWVISTLKMSNLYIRDPFKLFHRNNIKYSIHSLAIKACYFFLWSGPLTDSSGWPLPTILNREPYSFIQGFQKGIYPNLLISIVISIKLGDHKRVTVFHDNRGQGSTQDILPNLELTHSNTTCLFI